MTTGTPSTGTAAGSNKMVDLPDPRKNVDDKPDVSDDLSEETEGEKTFLATIEVNGKKKTLRLCANRLNQAVDRVASSEHAPDGDLHQAIGSFTHQREIQGTVHLVEERFYQNNSAWVTFHFLDPSSNSKYS